MTMLRVAHILGELKHSGAEVMLASAGKYLSDGSSLVVSTGQKLGDYAPFLEAAGFKLAHKPRSSSPSYFNSLGHFLKNQGVEVVHLHTEASAVWYSLMAWRHGIPSVRTIHNEFKFEGLLRRRRIATRHIAGRLGTVHVACSPSVQENEFDRFGLKATLINNWMDPDRIPAPSAPARASGRAELGVDEDVLVAVSIANEAPAKNLISLFQGVESAAATGVKIRLYHCGAIGPSLKAFAEGLPHGSIVILGTVVDITPYLAASDVFVSTSFNEGGQISLLEASAAGLICVTTRVGIAGAFDGQAGVTFIDSDGEALAAALRLVAVCPQTKRRTDGLALAKWVRSYFLPERGAREYQSIYKREFNFSELSKGQI